MNHSKRTNRNFFRAHVRLEIVAVSTNQRKRGLVNIKTIINSPEITEQPSLRSQVYIPRLRIHPKIRNKN